MNTPMKRLTADVARFLDTIGVDSPVEVVLTCVCNGREILRATVGPDWPALTVTPPAALPAARGWLDFSPAEIELINSLPLDMDVGITFDEQAKLVSSATETNLRGIRKNAEQRKLLEIRRGGGAHRCPTTPTFD